MNSHKKAFSLTLRIINSLEKKEKDKLPLYFDGVYDGRVWIDHYKSYKGRVSETFTNAYYLDDNYFLGGFKDKIYIVNDGTVFIGFKIIKSEKTVTVVDRKKRLEKSFSMPGKAYIKKNNFIRYAFSEKAKIKLHIDVIDLILMHMDRLEY